MPKWRLSSDHQLSRATITALEGRLSLGLVNRFHPRSGRHIHDALTGYADLVTWNRSVGILTGEQERYLLQQASAHPQEALKAFERALAVRESVFRVFAAVAAGSSPQR